MQSGLRCTVVVVAPWHGQCATRRASSVAYGQSPHHEPRPPPVRPRGAPAVLPVLCLVLVDLKNRLTSAVTS